MATNERNDEAFDVYRSLRELGFVTDKDDPEAVARAYTLTRFGARAEMSLNGGEGYWEMTSLRGGFFVNRTEAWFPDSQDYILNGTGSMRIRIVLTDAHAEFGANDMQAMADGSHCGITVVPEGQQLTVRTDGGRWVRAVALQIPRRTLSEVWNFDTSQLPELFSDFEEGRITDTVQIILGIGPRLARLATEILECGYDGDRLRLFLNAKAQELFCLILDAMLSGEEAELHGSKQIADPETAAIGAAREIVRENFQTPPSIDELCRTVGLSRNKLCFGFQKLFGAPIYEYCRELRMQKALELLEEGKLSITQVALEVGYEHPSTLTTAVRRRFGCTPKELRARVNSRI